VETHITSYALDQFEIHSGNRPVSILVGFTVRQDRKRLGDEFWNEPLSQGVFDLQVRRKPQALAAVAVIQDGLYGD
jgi:hypothetical protein